MKIPPTIGEIEEMNLRPTVVASSWLSAVPRDLHWSRCMHVVEQVGRKVSGWLGVVVVETIGRSVSLASDGGSQVTDDYPVDLCRAPPTALVPTHRLFLQHVRHAR